MSLSNVYCRRGCKLSLFRVMGAFPHIGEVKLKLSVMAIKWKWWELAIYHQ